MKKATYLHWTEASVLTPTILQDKWHFLKFSTREEYSWHQEKNVFVLYVTFYKQKYDKYNSDSYLLPLSKPGKNARIQLL